MRSLPIGAKSCAYWSHYSFRVGITKKSVWDTVGEFAQTTEQLFFEREYANRYTIERI